MTHLNDLPFHRLQFYATAQYPCSYLKTKQARSQVATPGYLINKTDYSALVNLGFRRSGTHTYRPHCDNCQACTPLRVRSADFKLNRSQFRAWRQHSNLKARISDLKFVPDHYYLYLRYQNSRHTGGGMDNDNVETYKQFLLTSQVNTWMVEFYEPSGQAGTDKIKMVSIIDEIDNGLSAVYTFYEPELSTSYGTYNILWQIELSKLLKLPYVYLGYWIEESRKMSYKSKFRPYELLINGTWVKHS